MKKYDEMPAKIKLIVALVIIDVLAMFVGDYIEVMNDPDFVLFSFENIIYILPLLYFLAVYWLIKTQSSVIKYLFYIVLAIEVTALFGLNLLVGVVNLQSLLSIISVLALATCVVILNTREGRKWFATSN